MRGERSFVGGYNEVPRELSEEDAEDLDQRRKYLRIFDSIKNNDNSVQLMPWQRKLYAATMKEGMTAEEWVDQQIEVEKNDRAKRDVQREKLRKGL